MKVWTQNACPVVDPITPFLGFEFRQWVPLVCSGKHGFSEDARILEGSSHCSKESPQGWLQGIQDPAREYERQSCTPRHFEVQPECSGKLPRLCTATLTGPVQHISSHGSPVSTCLSHSMWWDPEEELRESTHAPSLGVWSLNHWTTKEVPFSIFEQFKLLTGYF